MFRDRELQSVMIGSYAMLSVHKSNVEGMDTKAPCPAGCDEEGRCVPGCFRCAGFGYVHQDNEKMINVVAAEGRVGDWAAYAETRHRRVALLGAPDHGMGVRTLEESIHYHGIKLVQKEAERIFPEWAIRLRWRE